MGAKVSDKFDCAGDSTCARSDGDEDENGACGSGGTRGCDGGGGADDCGGGGGGAGGAGGDDDETTDRA